MVDWKDKKKNAKDKVRDVHQFLDFWNKVALVLITFLLIVSIVLSYLNQSILTGILILVTGLYAFTTFIQMREARKQSYSRPVQPDIDYSAEHDAEVPGIRNFGSETAYSIEFLASLESSGDADPFKTREITKWESPTTLKPDEFEPVVEDIEKFEEKLHDIEEGQLSLYYAYSTASTHRIPPSEEELLDKNITEIQEKYPKPTSFDVGSLQERCFPKKTKMTNSAK